MYEIHCPKGASGTTKSDGEARKFLDGRNPEGHVYRTSRQATIKIYHSTYIKQIYDDMM